MEIVEMPIDGAFVCTPQVHGDDRGTFLEWFKGDRFSEAVGHRLELAQANASVSAAGTLRGIHFAAVPPGQAKYVTCMQGAILDVVVDLRRGSPTFGRWEGVRLDTQDRRAVYLGEGLGHAFLALEDNSVVNYLCSTPYAPEREHAVSPLDPAIGIEWPEVRRDGQLVDHILSDKDRGAPSLAEAEQAGLLPTLEATRSWISSLVSRSDRA